MLTVKHPDSLKIGLISDTLYKAMLAQVPAPDLNAALRRLLPTAPRNWLDDTPSDGA